MSVLSAGCILWLQRLQPVFAVIAVAALTYESWLVLRRPAQMRTRRLLAILWGSVAITVLVFGVWLMLSLRYR